MRRARLVDVDADQQPRTKQLAWLVACAVVFIGTLAPLFREMWDGQKISVGAPFFDASFTPFMILLAIALPFGAILPWKRGDLSKAGRKMIIAAVIAFLVAATIWGLSADRSPFAPIGIALAAWLIFGVAVELADRSKLDDLKDVLGGAARARSARVSASS